MAVGFRKSLFGFNPDDVMAYIEKTHKSFSEKQTELNEEIEALRGDLNLSKEGFENLILEKDKIAAELHSFAEKYEEIERLSENIGKLYLVAQANAQAIMANSEKNAKLTDHEITKNIGAINDVHDSLSDIRASILKTSDEFAAQVEGLMNSLNDTKTQIAENINDSESHKYAFEAIYESLK